MAETLEVRALPKLSVFQPERSYSLTPWFVAGGVLSIALAVYVLAAWIVSGDATRTSTGIDEVPIRVKALVIAFQATGVALLIGGTCYFWRCTRRTGRLSLEAAIFIAWTITIWMDPASNNYIRPQLLYNSYFVNFGSWAPHIPGWLSPNANLLPEPILAWSGIYGSQVFMSLACVGLMRAVKRRRPATGKLGLLGVAFVAFAVFDLVMEVILIRGELYAYPGAIQWLSLFPGSRYQFPLYEPIVFGGLITLIGALLYFRDDRGRSWIERGIDEETMSPVRAGIVRTLAATGFIMVVYLGYCVIWSWAPIYGGPYPKDIPSYLLNGICGPGTQYECMGPDVPVPLPGSGPLPPRHLGG